MSNKKSIEYIKELYEEDGVILAKKEFISVTTSCTKRYHNCIYLLFNLANSTRNLLDYLCENMDENNMIRSDIYIINNFIEFISKVTKGKVNYSVNTVKSSFMKLKKKGLLIQLSRGMFKVNPKFFFRGDEKDRLNQIKLLIMFDNNKDTSIDVVKEHIIINSNTEIKANNE